MKPRNIFDHLRNLFRRVQVGHNPQPPEKSYETEKFRMRILVYMRQKKPYLKRGYRIKDMAADLGVPAHQLSAFINKEMGMHFADLVNQSRVEYCKRVLRSSPPEGTPTIKELAAKCGFNNRNTFSAAFKKYTGNSPSQFMGSPKI